ncbi:MAG: sigma-70 family RNA polymerase sigma factor [Planctomycetes bacterium]|nr:sigma-70 family RNA polymerase sigma factor [Planctomycetota bacterium]
MPSQPEGLQPLLDAHWTEVYSLLLAITRHPTTAEELSQDVFVVALRKGIVPGPATRLWLREVARRLAMNELRRKRPQAMPAAWLESLADAVAWATTPAAEDGSFEDELAALRRCLADLDEPDRRVLAARYEGGRHLADIAAEVEQTVGYLKQRFFRLRRRLAECIQRRLAESGAMHA